MKDLAGKTAVITGGASGIGLCMARAFGAEGMRLVLADVEEPALDRAVGELSQAGHEAIGVPLRRREVRPGGSVGAGGRRALRPRSRRLQQRRGFDHRANLQDEPGRLAMGLRRQSLGRDTRDKGIRADADGAWRRGACHQHGLACLLQRHWRSRALLLQQGCRAVGKPGALQRDGCFRHQDRRERRVSRHGGHGDQQVLAKSTEERCGYGATGSPPTINSSPVRRSSKRPG